MKKNFAFPLFLTYCLCFVMQAKAYEPKLDPIKFTISTNASQVALNEQFEIKITARYLNVPAKAAFVLEGSTAFKLKLVTPDGFVKTGGDFHDFAGTELSSSVPSITYTLKGKFTTASDNGVFQLLRSHKNADNQSTFIEVGRLIYNLEKDPVAENQNARILLSGAPGDVPYLSMAQLRSGAGNQARAVYVTDEEIYGLFRYDSLSIASDDSVMTIVSGSLRYSRVIDSYVNARWFGIKGDGVTDETAKWQKMINHSRVHTMWFPKPEVSYRINKITVPSNKTFLFEDNTLVRGLGILDINKNERMFSIRNVENVVFKGKVTFRDIKANYAGAAGGEQRHVFLIQGSKNVTLEGITAGDSGGDGFYIGATPENPYSENIIIRDCIADNNKRQGMSIISVKNMLVDNCIFKNTAGTLPGAGIDLEPNSITDRYQGLRFMNCRVENNEGDGMLILFSNNTNSPHPVDVVIENMVSIGSDAGIQLANCRGSLAGEIVIKNFHSQDASSNGIRVKNWSANGPRITFETPTVSNPNVNNHADAGYGAGVYIVRESTDVSDTLIGNAHFYNLKIEDTRAVPLIKAGFSMSSTTVPIVNCSLINPISFKGVPTSTLARVYGGGILVRDDHDVLVEQVTTPMPGYSTVSIANYRHLFHNEGQTAERQVVLNNLGRYWKAEIVFEVRAPQYLRIDPNSANAIRPLTTTGGKYIRSNVVGSRIVLNWSAASAGWVVKSMIGTWEVEP